jgi:hypothetical protein
MIWWCLSFALAAEPEVRFDDDGTVHASLRIDAPPEAVLAVVSDAPRMAKWSDDVLSFQPVGAAEGDCQQYEVKTKGLWNPLTYVSKRCRTADGFHETLVRSDSFSVIDSRWVITPAEGGTQVQFAGDLELSMSVPKALLKGARSKSIAHTLRTLRDTVTGQE